MPAGGNRYLSSDISYFGVGSKNAAFYMGKTVKVVSKTGSSSYVHELCIQGELEHECLLVAGAGNFSLRHPCIGQCRWLTHVVQEQLVKHMGDCAAVAAALMLLLLLLLQLLSWSGVTVRARQCMRRQCCTGSQGTPLA
jgi:hypothetical protein